MFEKIHCIEIHYYNDYKKITITFWLITLRKYKKFIAIIIKDNHVR